MPDLAGGAGPARAVCEGAFGQSRRAAARLLLASEGEALNRKATELVLGGVTAVPRTHCRPVCEPAVKFAMPPVRSAADLTGAMAAVAEAAGLGRTRPFAPGSRVN